MSTRLRFGFLVVLITVLAPGLAGACTCAWTGPFTTVALGADLVALVEVLGYQRHGMDVAIIEVLRGRETRSIIRIWGDTGALCRPYVTAFPIGTRWILAVHRSRTLGEGDFAISFCGEHWLEARGQQAVGRITIARYGDVREIASLADVRAWLRAGGATPLAPAALP
jgi:hypothetical protein